MKRHLVLALMTCALLAPAFASDKSSITTAKGANGRTIFVNDESSPKQRGSDSAQAQDFPRRTTYMYYSRQKRRWIKVGSSTTTGQRAQSAAKEVELQAADATPTGKPDTQVTIKPSRARMTDAQVDAAIDQAAARHNVDPSLVRAVVKVESNFNPHAVSRKGAVGLMQLMPSTARQLKVIDPYDPKQIIELYWNGTSETGRRWFAPTYRSAPIRVSKDAQGHLVFNNTE